jgi:HEAT repeat protein
MRLLHWAWIVALLLVAGASLSAGQALDKNAQRVVNDATKDLKSKDVQRRVDAIDNLRSWGKLTTAPLIIGALKDPEARVRAAAADALWNGDMKTEAARAPLMAALDDPALEVAVLAAGALRVLGASKADVQQANERGLSSRDPRIRFLAARALIGLAPPAQLVSPLVAYLERQSSADARSNVELAEHALEELRDTKDRTILQPLVDAVPIMIAGAPVVLKVLGEVQPRPAGWTALLVSQAMKGEPNVRRQSLLLMRDLKGDADVAQWSPTAARLLATDSDDVVRSYAADALEFAGGAAHAHAAAVLDAAQRDRSASVRSSAFDALTAIIGRTGTAPAAAKATMAKAALPVVQVAIDADPDNDVRENAIDALDALALDAAQSASLLVALAGKTSLPENLRTLALSKLRNRGAEARSVAGDLQKLKADSSAAVRERAAEALERMADRSAPAPRAPATPGAPPAAPRNTAGPVASPKPTAEDEARGLSLIRGRKVEFVGEQFYKAIGDNDVELTRAFLDAGMSARNTFPFARKETPLTVAVGSQSCSPTERPTAAATLEVVQLLIARGADAAIADEHGNTPLMEAASSGCDAAVMRALLKAGGQLNAVNSAGLTAFEFGLFSGHDGLDALVAAGYRLPAAKVKTYLEAYKANLKAVALVKKAAP